MKNMGGMASLMDKLPAQFQQAAGNANMDQADKQVRRMVGIIDSMTKAERAKPELIKPPASAASRPAPVCRCRK
jgi:signal recognition particle subunit SRP54